MDKFNVTLLFFLLFAFEEAAPCPLDLNGSDVVHGKAMVFEKPTRQRHFVRSLYESSTEITIAVLFAAGHHVEGRSEELRSELLSCRCMCLITRLQTRRISNVQSSPYKSESGTHFGRQKPSIAHFLTFSLRHSHLC